MGGTLAYGVILREVNQIMRAPSFYSDPHVQFLSQLLEEIGEGALQVPRFQRPLVWDWDRRLELLRSIRDGIPIGSIMVWRTSTVAIDCYDRLGPHPLAPPQNNMPRQYILDGVQRLSTLYGALHRPQVTSLPPSLSLKQEGELPDYVETDTETGPFDVFFDPATGDFISPEMDDQLRSSMMPVSLAFDSVALLRFQRKLAHEGNERAIQSTDRLAKAFRDYKIPIIPITTDDINLATRTFQRINSQGARMTEAHMVHALTWNTKFDLQTRLSEAKSLALTDLGWASMDDDPILKACKVAFGLDVYRTNAQEFSTALLTAPNVLEEVVLATARAARFLWMECGVPSPELVPYALQIVVLSEAFRVNPTPTANVLELLRSWFWMTTYGELFAGMSGDRVQLAISDIHDTVIDENPTWTWKRPWEDRPLRPTFDFRAARAKAFAFRLAGLQDQIHGDRRGTELFATAGRKALTQVLPWTRDQKDIYSSPGNRFLVAPSEFQNFRDRLLSGHVSATERNAHAISPIAFHLLMSGDHLGFVKRRVEDVTAIERIFVSPFVERFGGRRPDNVQSENLGLVFEDYPVTVIQSNGENEFVIIIDGLTTPISISLKNRDGYVWFSTSHAIKTPMQLGPYWTSRPFDDDPRQALRRAISGLTDYYEEAVSAGYKPSNDWLVQG